MTESDKIPAANVLIGRTAQPNRGPAGGDATRVHVRGAAQ